MGRATFKIWMDDMYERQGLFGTTAVDAEYELLTMNEDGPAEWLTHLEDEGAEPESALTCGQGEE